PLAVRRTLLRYWRQWPGRFQIWFVAHPHGGLATCSAEGYHLWFDPKWWVFPDSRPEQAQAHIAHELAHAYRWATLGAQLFGEPIEQSETETRRLNISWGFQDTPFNKADYKDAIKREQKIAALMRRKQH